MFNMKQDASSRKAVEPVSEVSAYRTLTAVCSILEDLDTPISLGIALRLQHGEHLDAVKLSVHPRNYIDPDVFARDYAASKLVSKLQGLDTKLDLESVALQKFHAAEQKCRSTNVRLFYGRPLTWDVERVIERARRKILSIIGESPDYSFVLQNGRWGPGSTATLKGDSARPECKMLEPRLSVTKGAYRMAQTLVGLDLHWSKARLDSNTVEVLGPCTLLASEFEIIEWMRVVTVPKDSKTDRTIGAEPTLNGYIQAGVGRLLRRHLRVVGIDLDNQTINQTWAQLALELGLATVDLSSASDSISYWLVEMLLPPAWFRLLDSLRSGFAKLPSGKVIPLEKFSSMGNGFTFELESLLFYAIAYAVCVDCGEAVSCVSVYGDDIIIPASAYSRLTETLQVLGFEVNTEKSYADGVFYESCGEHYFGGVRVTPMYQKEPLHGLPELVRLHNRLCRWYGRIGLSDRDDSRPLILLREWGRREAGDRLPTTPHGYVGDSGFWVRGLRCPFIDGRVLLYQVEEETSSDESLSDEALYALALKGTAAERATTVSASYESLWDVQVVHRDPLVSRRSETGANLVPLRTRNRPRYRSVRRWVELVHEPTWLGPFRNTAATALFRGEVITLIPQLRCDAVL